MPRFSLDALRCPVVQAPMGGGPSTPALAAAVSGAGGLGFLAAGYKTPGALRAELEQLRGDLSTAAPFGVNLFAPPGHGDGVPDVGTYAATLAQEAARIGIELGEPRWDDDRYEEKLELLREQVRPHRLPWRCPPPPSSSFSPSRLVRLSPLPARCLAEVATDTDAVRRTLRRW